MPITKENWTHDRPTVAGDYAFYDGYIPKKKGRMKIYQIWMCPDGELRMSSGNHVYDIPRRSKRRWWLGPIEGPEVRI